MKSFIVNQEIEVSLTQQQQKIITLDYLCEKFNWKLSYFIEDGKVYTNTIYHGSHSWNQKELIREASEIDFFVCGTIKKIQFD